MRCRREHKDSPIDYMILWIAVLLICVAGLEACDRDAEIQQTKTRKHIGERVKWSH